MLHFIQQFGIRSAVVQEILYFVQDLYVRHTLVFTNWPYRPLTCAHSAQSPNCYALACSTSA